MKAAHLANTATYVQGVGGTRLLPCVMRDVMHCTVLCYHPRSGRRQDPDCVPTTTTAAAVEAVPAYAKMLMEIPPSLVHDHVHICH